MKKNLRPRVDALRSYRWNQNAISRAARIVVALLSLGGVVVANSAHAQQKIVEGNGATANTQPGADPNHGVALGPNAHADSTSKKGSSPVAIGPYANASGQGSQVAIGDMATASGTNSIAIGGNPYKTGTAATGDYSVSIGSSSNASGYGSFAFGGDGTSGAKASGKYSMAFGPQSVASAENALAFGTGASSTGTSAVAFGVNAAAGAENALAFGTGAQASNAGDVAIGANSTTAAAVATKSVKINGATYGFSGTAPTSTVSIGSAGEERTLTNVAAGRISASSTDAVNGSQLNATNLALAAEDFKVNTFGSGVATALGGGAAFDPSTGAMSAPMYGVYGQTYSDVGGALTALQRFAPVQYSSANAPTTGLGDGAPVSNDVTLVGADANAPVSLHNVAEGVDATDAVNVGQLTQAINTAVVNVLPITPTAWVDSNPANYTVPVATGTDALAVGSASVATGQSSTAVGTGSTASGQSSTAIGSGSNASADNSVALGANSVANEANTVSVGSAGNERRVTNVAPGVNGTDAVNVNQMNAGLGHVQNQVNNLQTQVNDNLKKSYGGTAAAIAIAGLRYDDRPGKISAGVASGWYHNQMGLALGIGGTSNDGVWRVNGGLTMSPTLSSPDVGGAVGVTYTFN